MISVPHINICICTLQRPALLRRLLQDLATQQTRDQFTFSAIVADNDPAESARSIVENFAASSSLRIEYVVEPRRSISHARNKSLEPAKGRYVAFIDDDEFPASDWLLNLYLAARKHQATGVFGPVRPHYDAGTPEWVKKAGFYERPEHSTGFIIPWQECRTGNVLVDRSALERLDPVFRSEFGSGASDQDLFRRLMEIGHHFIWCNDAIAYEVVPLGRCRRIFLIKRALLRGSISLRHPKGRLLNTLKALVALPLYTLALPFLQLGGHHLFMKYLVKLCDHAGRLFALFGFLPVRIREMQ
ncbi:MAG TPA: glycosyltransferase family 2 protein [Candidatus Paceibacterota bacterium]|nr:glycosyltransferase family 2 protein [Candidatus Paceibacterota bacterium]